MTPSTPDVYVFDSRVSQEHEDDITERLIAFNKAHSPMWERNHDEQFSPAPLHLFILDTEAKVIGGLVGRTHSLRDWLEISVLWVDPLHRGNGLGRELMARAEAEACRRGCVYARLSTGNYQAPGFYEKLGYVLYGTLENCPPGDTSYYYCKQLNP